MKSKMITLDRMPVGVPKIADFGIIEEEIEPLKSGQLLLKLIYVSVDPYLRAKMSGGHQPPLHAGDVIYSRAVAEVIESKHKDFAPGNFVIGFMEWREYLVSEASGLTLLDPQGCPLSTYLGVIGSTGLSAYFALTDIGKPKPGQTMVVSGAAGAVGSIAGQIGKIMGCRVIGIAGSDEKAKFIRSSLGYDAAINYNTCANISVTIAALCPEGVDVYFDNVGGDISDAVISNMSNYGRVVVCGSISSYNDTVKDHGLRLLPLVVFKKLLIQGFLIADYKDRYAEGISQLQQWLADGKIHYAETILQGFERLPEAFIGLFSGQNEGKMIVQC